MTHFEYAPGISFTCTRCGDCCHNNVLLGPGEEERLRSLDWHGRDSELAGAVTVVSSSLPDGRAVQRLARREDGACIYLGSDNLCRIHRDFGADAKPLMCRLYPFGFYSVGDRVAVDCSFSCRSISLNSGSPLAERTAEWNALLKETTIADKRSHRLTRQKALSSALLWEIEHYLLGFLSDRNLSLFDRLRCCLQFNRLATTGDPSTPAAAKLREAIARGLPKQIAKIPRGGGMDRTQRSIFYQWLFLALNPSPVNADLLTGVDRQREEQRRVALAQQFSSQKGKPLIENRELAASWNEIAHINADLVTAPSCPPLERYFTAKILGQRFLIAGDEELPVVEAIPFFFLVYPMTIWTARALAAESGAQSVDEEHLRRALVLLDRTAGLVPLSTLPEKVAETWHFIVEETDLAIEATNELVGWQDESSSE